MQYLSGQSLVLEADFSSELKHGGFGRSIPKIFQNSYYLENQSWLRKKNYLYSYSSSEYLSE